MFFYKPFKDVNDEIDKTLVDIYELFEDIRKTVDVQS
jgi:hypothetical protein